MEEVDKRCLMIRIGVSGECCFWYWLTRVVPDKGPLNGCVCWVWINQLFHWYRKAIHKKIAGLDVCPDKTWRESITRPHPFQVLISSKFLINYNNEYIEITNEYRNVLWKKAKSINKHQLKFPFYKTLKMQQIGYLLTSYSEYFTTDCY